VRTLARPNPKKKIVIASVSNEIATIREYIQIEKTKKGGVFTVPDYRIALACKELFNGKEIYGRFQPPNLQN
jgi:hypothetical protein